MTNVDMKMRRMMTLSVIVKSTAGRRKKEEEEEEEEKYQSFLYESNNNTRKLVQSLINAAYDTDYRTPQGLLHFIMKHYWRMASEKKFV